MNLTKSFMDKRRIVALAGSLEQEVSVTMFKKRGNIQLVIFIRNSNDSKSHHTKRPHYSVSLTDRKLFFYVRLLLQDIFRPELSHVLIGPKPNVPVFCWKVEHPPSTKLSAAISSLFAPCLGANKKPTQEPRNTYLTLCSLSWEVWWSNSFKPSKMFLKSIKKSLYILHIRKCQQHIIKKSRIINQSLSPTWKQSL